YEDDYDGNDDSMEGEDDDDELNDDVMGDIEI
ncbi:hypothetical protein OXX79_011987, partial [Metschnikowia pulcherrima]